MPYKQRCVISVKRFTIIDLSFDYWLYNFNPIIDPCFSYDTDSPLNDINPSPYAKDGEFGTKDIYECQKLCQRVYDCKFFVFDSRLFSTKCWLKTGKSFFLPPVAGTILGPKHCDDGYHAPADTNVGSPYDAPPPPRDAYEEPEVVPPPPRDNYEEPKVNYEEPNPNFEEPQVVESHPFPVDNYQEPGDNYQEPETSYKEPDYKGKNDYSYIYFYIFYI